MSRKDPNPARHEWFKPAPDCPNGIGIGSGSSGSHERSLALTVTGLPSNPSRFGERIEVEAELRNIGKEEIEIPWSEDPGDVDRKTSGTLRYREANFRIAVTGTKNELWSANSKVSLYGSEEKPSTLYTMNPGEVLRFRFEVSLEDTGVSEKLLRAGGEFRTTVFFFISARTVTTRKCYLDRGTSQLNSATAKPVQLVLLPTERPN